MVTHQSGPGSTKVGPVQIGVKISPEKKKLEIFDFVPGWIGWMAMEWSGVEWSGVFTLPHVRGVFSLTHT